MLLLLLRENNVKEFDIVALIGQLLINADIIKHGINRADKSDERIERIRERLGVAALLRGLIDGEAVELLAALDGV